MSRPIIRHLVNLWSMVEYPSAQSEWNLREKLEAVKEAGFDGITTYLSAETAELARKLDLLTVGFFSSSDPSEFRRVLEEQRDNGARFINVQLGDHDTPVEQATDMAVELMRTGKELGVAPSVEVHRDTATETPEKTWAIADGYQRITGELLPMTFDFSHIAVVKHLAPPYWERLLERPELIQRSEQWHLRPFNGHHCQVPVTDDAGRLTVEVRQWFGFLEKAFEMIMDAPANEGREIFCVPEMGPVRGGYNLSSLPNSWEDAKVLRGEIDRIWREALERVNRPQAASV